MVGRPNSSQMGISLITGLGNPGSKYAETRHNAGFWFIQKVQQAFGFTLKDDKRYKGLVGSFTHGDRSVRVIAPQTFMNLSGDSVVPFARFYRIPEEEILVAYDELDLEPGTIRLKLSGGHGGHNGLRDIMQKSGSDKIKRIRIGIGHPGNSMQVSDYVLSRPHNEDKVSIDHSILQAVNVMPRILSGDFSAAMNQLHTSTRQ